MIGTTQLRPHPTCLSRLCNAKRSPGFAVSRSRRSVALSIVAFKESDKTVTDWRVQQMISVSRKYYDNVWSKGNLEICQDILDDQVLYKDMTNNPAKVVVGLAPMQEMIASMREVYPDIFFDIEQIGFCDSSHVFVQWSAEATNLGSHHGHKPTHHHSKWTGVDMVGFNANRTKISEITVYRQLTNEERQELHGMGRTSGVVSFEDRYELRLPRLHWEANELRMPE